MVNIAALTTASIIAARQAAVRRQHEESRRRQQEEAARQRRIEDERKKRDAEEKRRREAKEREQQRQKAKKKHLLKNEGKLQGVEHHAEQQSAEFTTELSVEYSKLPIAHEGLYESLLADGSKLYNVDKTFVRMFPDGRVREYRGNKFFDRWHVLKLTKEELPSGAMVVYKDGQKVYEKDAEGNYSYYKYHGEKPITGNVNSETSQEFTKELSIKYDDLPIVHEGEYKSVLADGSVLSKLDEKYVRTFPDGRVQEYSSNIYKRMLNLTKEELPSGAVVVYDEGQKVYEKDAQGNYTYHKTGLRGQIKQTFKGKVSTEPSQEFTKELSIHEGDLQVVHKGAYESLLADGSVWSGTDGKFVRTFPDGRVQEYSRENYGYVLKLTKEELPSGAMVVYDDGQKVYEKDAQGNYTYHKIGLRGKVIRTVTGKVTESSQEFTKDLIIKQDDLLIVHEGAYENLLADGSRLVKLEEKYVRTLPDGRVQEYNGNTWVGNERVLKLTKEELPNGAVVVYDGGKKVYERDDKGNYTYHKEGSGGRREKTIESKDGIIKTTHYDADGKPSYYTVSNEPNKKYYPSGKLYEEQTDKGEHFRYAENGVCLYEKNEKGEYAHYQLTPDGKDRLLIEKGTNGVWSEMYSYYPSGAIKTEKIGGRYGQSREYAENGVCLYEKVGKGSYRKYQLTPDGKDRLLIVKVDNFYTREQYEYYPSGKLKEAIYNDSLIKYNEDGTYQKFDKKNRLKEETTKEGKTVYTYYQGTKQVEHIHKYDLEGKDIALEYKHFDKEGKENTAYYLAMKRIIANKIEKHDQKQAKKGIKPEDRTASKKMSKAGKLFAHIKAKLDSRDN